MSTGSVIEMPTGLDSNLRLFSELTLTVPSHYHHDGHIGRYISTHAQYFGEVDKQVNDGNYGHHIRPLEANQHVDFKLYGIIEGGVVRAEEIGLLMDLLGAQSLGVHFLFLLHETGILDQIPTDKIVVAPTRKMRRCTSGRPKMPVISRRPDGLADIKLRQAYQSWWGSFLFPICVVR